MTKAEMMTSRTILSISRMTIHNGPGIRTLLLFKGCPLRCLWCSTPESQKAEPEIALYPDRCIGCGLCVPACPSGAVSVDAGTVHLNRSLCDGCARCVGVCHSEAIRLLGHRVTVEKLVEEAKKDAVFYKHSGGGVTISGGEPLWDSAFALTLVRTLKKEGVSTGVDTCGHVPWTSIEQILPFIDFFLWDLKHMDSRRHRDLTGVSNELILANAAAASQRNIPIYIRIPLIPGYNDSEENIRATCRFIRSLSSVVEVHILPVHHLGKARYESLSIPYPIDHVPLIGDTVLQDLLQLVESYGLRCRING